MYDNRSPTSASAGRAGRAGARVRQAGLSGCETGARRALGRFDPRVATTLQPPGRNALAGSRRRCRPAGPDPARVERSSARLARELAHRASRRSTATCARGALALRSVAVRRGGGAAERTGLENRRRGATSSVGSNPTPAARTAVNRLVEQDTRRRARCVRSCRISPDQAVSRNQAEDSQSPGPSPHRRVATRRTRWVRHNRLVIVGRDVEFARLRDGLANTRIGRTSRIAVLGTKPAASGCRSWKRLVRWRIAS